MRVTAAMCRARLRRRSPPRLMRWRTVLPDEAGIGFTPARLAKPASERTRPGCDHAAKATAAVTGPMPGWLSSTRAGLRWSRSVICLVLAASSRSAASDPRDGSLQSCDRGWELGVIDHFAGRTGQDGHGVVGGVGINPDDERMGMRDDCHW